MASHWKLTVTIWEPSLKLILLKLQEKLPKNSTSIILWSFWYLKQIGKVKKLHKRVPDELTENKKKLFWSVILSYSIQQKRAISLWDCDLRQKVDFLWQPAMTSSSGWTKKKLQNTSESQTWTKRRSWSLFGSLLPFWSAITFWVPVKPLHLRSVQRIDEIYQKLHLQLSLVNRKGLVLLHDNIQLHVV